MTLKPPISHFIVHGSSMLPTLKPGEHLFTLNWFFKAKKGDIMVAKLDQRYIIKRITKLKVVKEIKGVKVIKVYLKGDNKAESTDSRNFGWVAKQKIVGKLLFKL